MNINCIAPISFQGKIQQNPNSNKQEASKYQNVNNYPNYTISHPISHVHPSMLTFGGGNQYYMSLITKQGIERLKGEELLHSSAKEYKQAVEEATEKEHIVLLISEEEKHLRESVEKKLLEMVSAGAKFPKPVISFRNCRKGRSGLFINSEEQHKHPRHC